VLATLVLIGTTADAASVTLAWDEVADADGYILLWGPAPRDYRESIQLGKETSHTVTGLTEGQTYYFAIMAFVYVPDTIDRVESQYSDEVNGAAPCSYAFGTSPVSFGSGPAVGAFTVTVADTCQWTMTSSVAWIAVTAGASGSGSALVSYAVEENPTTEPRAGALMLAGQSFTIAQAGVPHTREIALAGALDFGSITAGSTATRTLIIRNGGNSTLTVSAISYPAGFSGDWPSGTVPPGGAQIVEVTFAPPSGTAAVYGGLITIVADQTGGVSSVAVTGTGVPPTRILSLAGGLAFGTVTMGATGTALLSIMNSGDSALTISSIEYPSGFTGNWSRGVIPPGDTQVVLVTFTPTEAIVYEGTIAVVADQTSGASSVAVSGTGTSPRAPVPRLRPAVLNFGATTSGGALRVVTQAQEVTVTFDGEPSAWTVSVDQPWLQLSVGSGTGHGRFTVAVVNPNDVIAERTSLSGTVTIVAGGSVASLPVLLTVVHDVDRSALPIGSFDTPVSGPAKLAGSVAVTGWALDDTGVDRVEIWRDVAPDETTVPYQGSGPGQGKIFIAMAAFVGGSRPDVEAAFPTVPRADRAGWGYLLGTWGLANGGNGTFTLYAFAFDQEGQSSTLGTKTIVVDNAHATKPFGALDTPGQGEIVLGALWNYGWALTALPSNADERVCTINGDGVQVAIDSGPLLPVQYGGERADIAGAFAGFSNSAHAGGAFFIDTTAFSNGIHQIGWFVTDSCGRQDGIGSRFFTVLNETGGTTSSVAAATVSTAPSQERDVLEPVEVLRADRSPTRVWPDKTGTRVVTIGVDERVELVLPTISEATYRGYHVVRGDRRGLPVGSSVDALSGVFYWQPGVAFAGRYDLTFVATAAGVERTLDVRVVVGPPVRIAIDAPEGGAAPASSFLVAGWAIDLTAAEGSGIDAVHVWACPLPGGDPIFLGAAETGGERPDVAAVYGPQFTTSGFNLIASGLRAGEYNVVVYPHRAATGAFEGAQVVRIGVR